MVNKLPRSPGGLDRVQSQASISGVPDFAVDTGAAGRALAQLGGSLSARLGQMADEAAAREGDQAGLNAGQRAGAGFIAKAQGDAAAAAREPGTGKDVIVRPADVSPGPADIDGTPLQLRHDGTIRGEAFDAAALKAYGWRFQAGIANDIGEAADANSDSPGGFDKAIGQISAKYRQDLTDPELTEIFDKTFAERVAPAQLAIAARHEANLKAAAKAAADEGTDAVTAELERNAYALGGNPAADTMLADPIKRAIAAIDHEVKDGTFTPKEGEAKRKDLTNRVLEARTQGTFDALPTPDAKQDFATSIMTSYASGKGPYAALTFEDAKKLSDTLYTKATTEQNRLTAEQKSQAADVKQKIADDVASIAGSGTGLDPNKAGLDPARVQLLIGQDGYDKWQADRSSAMKAWQATAGMDLESSQEISERLSALAPRAGQPGYADAQKIYTGAQKQAATVLEERKTDPLGQANRAGLVKLAAIDATTPEALQSSLEQRAFAAHVVAVNYGTPVTFFRPEERQSLATALAENPTLLPAFARSAAVALGPQAGKALSELSEAGPEVAHAAGVGIATGDNSVADDVARTLAAKKAGTFKAKMPTDNTMSDAAGRVLGDVFAQNDAARSAVIGTADILFEKDANTLGFDPGQVNKDGSTAQAAYARAVDRALGGRVVGGVKYGGLTTVNGEPTVAPSFLPADQPEKLITSMRDSDLAFLPPIASGNGIPVKAADLRGAHLVAIGDGQYRVALGDPQSLDPRYVAAKSGGFWTLDLRRLADLHALPDFAGRGPGFQNLFDAIGALTGNASRADAP